MTLQIDSMLSVAAQRPPTGHGASRWAEFLNSGYGNDAPIPGYVPTLGLLRVEHPERNATREFRIAPVEHADLRRAAGSLVQTRYSERGYMVSQSASHERPDAVTLVVTETERPVATLAVGLDAAGGLLCDELFRREADDLRTEGLTLCEFTKFAVDPDVRSTRVLASLFHVAFLYAHHMRGSDCALIEVNPRHVGFYRRVLDFEPCGGPRHNHRVDAPAVLMRLNLHDARGKLCEYAQRLGFSGAPR
jgi:hypothetical protein